jgi:hypothetical protein
MLCILNTKQIERIIDILSVFYLFPVKRLSVLQSILLVREQEALFP